jgi:4-carboxymuconolactone decarboxylase
MTGDWSFGTFGRFAETPVAEMSEETRSAREAIEQLRGIVPGPHKIWLSNPQLARAVAPTGAYFQRDSSLTKAEIEIAVNVINGVWGSAYANYEHEIIAQYAGDLDPYKVQALIAGLPTEFEDPSEQTVYELASTLARGRVVPIGLFRRAQEVLGDAGIVDVTVLMGWFTAVSLTLLAFDVPANALGQEERAQKEIEA